MSLLHTVTAIVKRDGKASVEDILREVEGVTRQQVLAALNNARQKGLVHCIGRDRQGKCGQQPGVFAPGPAPEKAPAPRRYEAHPLHSIWNNTGASA